MPERGSKENIADRRPLNTHAAPPILAPPILAPHRVLSRGAGHDSLSDAAQSANGGLDESQDRVVQALKL
jgi:hypothetical protein